MNEILILVGVPGSGKSTFANQLVKQNDRYVRINRDDIRHMLRNDYVVGEEFEGIVSAMQDSLIKSALAKNKSVILDNTHCKAKYIKEIADKYAKEATISLKIIGSELSIKEIKERNKNREKVVPEEVIDRMYKGFTNIVKTKSELLKHIAEVSAKKVAVEPMVQDQRLPKAILVDIDGTVAHMDGLRGPFEWNKVLIDNPDFHILDLIRALSKKYQVIFVSGRDGSCEEETRQWLDIYYGLPYQLLMRKAGDYRKDSIIKKEIFESHIKGKVYVEAVFDDRNQVVDMWRDMGLKCLQVQPGNF